MSAVSKLMPVITPPVQPFIGGASAIVVAAARRRDLDPALAVAEGDVGDLLEAERADVEVERAVLVGDRDDHRGDRVEVRGGLGHLEPPVGWAFHCETVWAGKVIGAAERSGRSRRARPSARGTRPGWRGRRAALMWRMRSRLRLGALRVPPLRRAFVAVVVGCMALASFRSALAASPARRRGCPATHPAFAGSVGATPVELRPCSRRVPWRFAAPRGCAALRGRGRRPPPSPRLDRAPRVRSGRRASRARPGLAGRRASRGFRATSGAVGADVGERRGRSGRREWARPDGAAGAARYSRDRRVSPASVGGAGPAGADGGPSDRQARRAPPARASREPTAARRRRPGRARPAQPAPAGASVSLNTAGSTTSGPDRARRGVRHLRHEQHHDRGHQPRPRHGGGHGRRRGRLRRRVRGDRPGGQPDDAVPQRRRGARDDRGLRAAPSRPSASSSSRSAPGTSSPSGITRPLRRSGCSRSPAGRSPARTRRCASSGSGSCVIAAPRRGRPTARPPRRRAPASPPSARARRAAPAPSPAARRARRARPGRAGRRPGGRP